MATYAEYIHALKHPFEKLARLEFLQPDGTVAFSVGSERGRLRSRRHRSSAFIQSGTLNVSLQNGTRRTADITLANTDNAFDYNVNNVWFGSLVRLMMGLRLPSGEEFMLPQGVFVIDSPQTVYNPAERTITYSLTDKWARLDGRMGGNLAASYVVPTATGGVNTNVFTALSSLLRLDIRNYEQYAVDKGRMTDPVAPVCTPYYNGKTYPVVNTDGTSYTVAMTDVPYQITVDGESGALSEVALELNNVLAGVIGYDAVGALRVEPSQNDIIDEYKPVLWSFTPENSELLGVSETAKNTEVYNDVIICGESLDEAEIYGRASNYDPKSDTNINLIGRRTYRETRASYWNPTQCIDLARFFLKQKTILQKSVSIRCGQLFHLRENCLVSLQRTDKPGSPTELHLISSYSLPIAQTGEMTINCTSVNDLDISVSTTSANLIPFVDGTYKVTHSSGYGNITVLGDSVTAEGVAEGSSGYTAITAEFTVPAGIYTFAVTGLSSSALVKFVLVDSSGAYHNPGTLVSTGGKYTFAITETGSGSYNQTITASLRVAEAQG